MADPKPPGTEIAGHYRITGLLGRGGFGITYAAQDLRGGQAVAIKELDLGRVDEWKSVELFEREARILANLDHPQIPDYIEFIPIRPDAPGYLVQELAPGRSLEARLEAGERFTEERVRDIARQLLGVLGYLSGLLPPVVHRDIKPGNVLLADDGRCYLVDFGSVRDAVEASRTGGSTVAGTFGYMAPEQLHGDASVRSDLFGLGMTIIHLLTGTSPADLGRKRLKVDFRSHVQVGEDFARFIDRLVEPVPEDRYQSAQAALDALSGIVRMPSPAGGDLSGQAIAQLVAQRQEQAEAAQRQQQSLAHQRAQEVARRSKPRVALHEDGEGLTVRIGPPPLARRVVVQLPIMGFLLINPGFAVVGGFPFMGPLWPIFSESFVARAVIWLVFLTVVNLAVAKLRGRVLTVRVAGDHYVAWGKHEKDRVALGPISELRVVPDEVSASGYGSAVIAMGDTARTFSRLSATDLATLQRVQQRIGS